MHVPINLATEPFRRDRPIVVFSAICAVLLVVLLGVQTYLILRERSQAAASRQTVESLRGQLAKVQTEQNTINATLRNPANAEVLIRSVLFNNLVQRKAISWSRLLGDIEGVLPNNVRLIQVRLPQVNARNEITLDMEVGAQQPVQLVEFIKNLEASKLFGPVTLSRSDPPSQNEPLYKYRMSVSYAQKL